jgi:ketosteroid isomerase-like protein
MYHAIVRSRLREGMARLNREQFEPMMQGFPAEFELFFPGLPGQKGPRFNLEGTLNLYRRIFEIYPDLKFQVEDLVVSGWPNNTRVCVKWQCQATRKNGLPYTNQGVHIFHLRWGKVRYLEIYCDTQSIAEVSRTPDFSRLPG